MSKKKPTVTKPVNLGPVEAPAKKPRAPAKKAESKLKKAIPSSVAKMAEEIGRMPSAEVVEAKRIASDVYPRDEFSENNRKPSLPSAANADGTVNFCIEFADQAGSIGVAADTVSICEDKPKHTHPHTHADLAISWFSNQNQDVFRFNAEEDEWVGEESAPTWNPEEHYALKYRPKTKPTVALVEREHGLQNGFTSYPEPLWKLRKGQVHFVVDVARGEICESIAEYDISSSEARNSRDGSERFRHMAMGLRNGLIQSTRLGAEKQLSAFMSFMDTMRLKQVEGARKSIIAQGEQDE